MSRAAGSPDSHQWAVFRTRFKTARPGTDSCRGLIDANLGSGLFKKRIGRSGAGKREGYRVIVARRGDGPWFFIEGYAKNERESVDIDSLHLIRRHAKALAAMTVRERDAAVEQGTLKEVTCDA